MVALNFNTSNQTWRQLFGNGLRYRIPPFQRDYSWTQDQWDDLWQDSVATLSPGEPAHYMGYFVLQTRDNRSFDVIDGQQRLTTLTLLALAVLRALQDLVESGVDPDGNRRRIEQLRSTYIGYLDPVTLVPQSKLGLNNRNDRFFQNYLVPLRKLPQRGLTASERLLRQGFEWLLRQVNERLGPARDGAALASLLDAVSDRLFFTVITVTDELNAFTVFETLNSRGVRLSPTDLLKNYLFSVVHRESPHPTEIDALERRWEAMVGRLGGETFTDFLRAHWNSRHRFVREGDLFKTMRASTPDKAAVFTLLRGMEEDLDTYAALPAPEDPLWEGEQRRHIRELRMFSVRQPWPLLMAAHRAFDADGFTALLRACSVISFRYNVIGGLATNDQERIYNTIAQGIARGEVARAGDAIRALAPIYIGDAAFRAAFEDKVLRTTAARNKQVVRYVLFQIEAQVSGAQHDPDSAASSLEHVLPENPGAFWPQVTDAQADACVYRLGNLTLLETGPNRLMGNRTFVEKRAGYADSAFEITRRIAAENEAWTVDRIAARQRWMAAQATSVWRLAQLS